MSEEIEKKDEVDLKAQEAVEKAVKDLEQAGANSSAIKVEKYTDGKTFDVKTAAATNQVKVSEDGKVSTSNPHGGSTDLAKQIEEGNSEKGLKEISAQKRDDIIQRVSAHLKEHHPNMPIDEIFAKVVKKVDETFSTPNQEVSAEKVVEDISKEMGASDEGKSDGSNTIAGIMGTSSEGKEDNTGLSITPVADTMKEVGKFVKKSTIDPDVFKAWQARQNSQAQRTNNGGGGVP